MYGICLKPEGKNIRKYLCLAISLCPSLHQHIYLSVYISINPSLWHPSIHQPIYPSIHQYKSSSPVARSSIYITFRLHPSTQPYIQPFLFHPSAIKPSISLPIPLSTLFNPPSLHLSLPLSFLPSISPSIHHFNPPSLHPCHALPSQNGVPSPAYQRSGCPIGEPALSPL